MINGAGGAACPASTHPGCWVVLTTSIRSTWSIPPTIEVLD